ncbi:MAG TPA: PEP/pyruvate-binding domain-containing protein, partial [Euzebyales bacterium]|nr:PEP/pyruvate-binding domain-containing protein [Euzebyales bacterium]
MAQRTRAATPVAPLRAFGRHDLAHAGGKGANLGELARNAFPVPDGFVITTDAYRAVVDGAGLATRIAEWLAAGDDAVIRDAVTSAPVPEDVRRAIAGAYADLRGDQRVAVRSSATAEDLPGAAFAGQQDTYLNVVGEEALVDAVRRCWASLWTERAIAYRRRLAIDPADVRIAVVVQRMVDAESAGVLFTANPVTGDRRQIVIEASSGLGEAVVSGLVTPDRYVLDATGTLRSWNPGRREVVISGAPGGGVVSASGGAEPVGRLPDHVLADLVRLGTAVATHFGRPQDIEWASADGHVHLLQARPMTALPPPPVRLNRIQRLLGSVLLEYLPVRPYPMDMTTWLPHGPAGLMAELLRSIGIDGAFEDFIQEEGGVAYRLVPVTPRPTPRLLLTPVRLAARALRHDPDRWTQDPRFIAFLSRVQALADRDLHALPWPELVRVPRQTFDLIRPITALRIDYLPRGMLALMRLLVTLALLGRSRLMGDLILGAPTRTTAANRALEALAAQVRDDPALSAAVATNDLDRVRRFRGFDDALRAFLAENGHRETASPILVSPPTWGDSVETVLGVISMLAARPPAADPADPAARALEQVLAHPLLRGAGVRARMVRWVRAARSAVAFREDTHFSFTKPLPILRRCLLEIGRRLRDAGVLATPDDVFHLRLEEVEGIADLAALPGSQARRLRAAVRARSARREELSGVRLIDPRLVFGRRDAGDALVSGTPAGGGTATGPVRLVRDPAQLSRLR